MKYYVGTLKKKVDPTIFNFSKARDKNSNNRIPFVKTHTRTIVNVHKRKCKRYIKLLAGFRSGKEDDIMGNTHVA